MKKMKNNKISNIMMLMVVLIILPLTFFTSCKSIKKPIYITKTHIDTIKQKELINTYDSVYITQYIKSDTVYLFQYKYKYIDKLKSDTINKISIQTIEKPIPIEIVKYKHYSYEKYLWIYITLISTYIVYRIKSKIRLFN